MSSQPTSGFLKLPRELRDEIYRPLVKSEYVIRKHRSTDALANSDLFCGAAWSLFSTNKQIYEEASYCFFTENIFTFACGGFGSHYCYPDWDHHPVESYDTNEMFSDRAWELLTYLHIRWDSHSFTCSMVHEDGIRSQCANLHIEESRTRFQINDGTWPVVKGLEKLWGRLTKEPKLKFFSVWSDHMTMANQFEMWRSLRAVPCVELRGEGLRKQYAAFLKAEIEDDSDPVLHDACLPPRSYVEHLIHKKDEEWTIPAEFNGHCVQRQ